MGTLDYMAPEQALDTHNADARSDVYSLGCTLYFLLTGRPPFGGNTITKKILAHREDPVPSLRTSRSDVPEWLDEAFQRMLAKNAADRPQTMAEVMTPLQQKPLPQTGRPTPVFIPSVLPGNANETLSLHGSEVDTSSRKRSQAGNRGGRRRFSATVSAAGEDISPKTSSVPLPPSERLPSSQTPDLGLSPDELGWMKPIGRRRRRHPARGLLARLSSRQRIAVGVTAGILFALVLFSIVITLRTKEGTLVVEINEPGATVKVLDDGGNVVIERAALAKGPLTIGIDPGNHRLRVEKAGFIVFAKEFSIASGGRETIRARLEPLARKRKTTRSNFTTAVLLVNVNPPDAKLAPLDKGVTAERQGTKYKVTVAQPSRDAIITFELTHAGYYRHLYHVHARPGEVIELTATTSPLPADYDKTLPPPTRDYWWGSRPQQPSLPTSSTPAPSPAVAPFDEKRAKEYQAIWAEYLHVPVVQTNSIGMKLVLIPPGEFDMGSTPEEVTRAMEEGKMNNERRYFFERVPSEGPRHRVKISQPFYLGMYHVTQAEYEKVMGVNPSNFSGRPMDVSLFKPALGDRRIENRDHDAKKVAGMDTSRHPVEMVSWADAMEFCRRLSARPDEQATQATYHLPTEAQWEYACRAGTTTRWSNGDDEAVLGDVAWFKKTADGITHPVGQKRPNAWGLYDMHGNVLQYCADCYGPDFYEQSPAVDPVGPSTRPFLSRGGAWCSTALRCRSAFRNAPSGGRLSASGFRVICALARTRAETVPGTAQPSKTGAMPEDWHEAGEEAEEAAEEEEAARPIEEPRGSRSAGTRNLAKRWLGYTVTRNLQKAVREIAPYTNIVMDHGWSAYGDKLIQEARRRKIKVGMVFFGKWQRNEFEKRGLELARKNRDVVCTVCWSDPDFNGYVPSELSSFGEMLHRELPGIQYWCLFGPEQGQPWRYYEIPEEIDGILLDCGGIVSPEAIEGLADRAFPRWIERAKGRPVLMYWTCWDWTAPGIVPKCSIGTFGRCAELVEKHGLAGMLMDNYGSDPVANVRVQPREVLAHPELIYESLEGLVGLQTRPELISEIKGVAKAWGISAETP